LFALAPQAFTFALSINQVKRSSEAEAQ